MWGLLTSKQWNMCSFLQKHRKGLGSIKCFLSPRDATRLCRISSGLQLLWLAVLSSTERLVLLLRVWALSPTATYTTGKKECTGLMTRRKSDKPHSHPSASIGQHWASESPAHSQPPTGLWQSLWKHSICIHSCYICMGTCTALLQSPLLHFSSHLCRGRRGLSEARHWAGGLKRSARRSNPLKADGKLVGGTEGLSTEADCHKWLQLLLRPWSWLQ